LSGYFRRAAGVIAGLLRQGVTPEKISLAIAMAAALGVFPVLGSTTLLCAGAALLFGLNPAAMQLVGWLVYPLQLALLVPLMRIGSGLFGLSPIPALPQLLGMLRADIGGTIRLFWPATLSAIGAWLVVSPIMAAAIYFTLLPFLRRMGRGLSPA
jgi:uncharacterized protein (DUF2062 family)